MDSQVSALARMERDFMVEISNVVDGLEAGECNSGKR